MQNWKHNHICLGYLGCETHYRLAVYLPPLPKKRHENPTIVFLAQLLSTKESCLDLLPSVTGKLPLQKGQRLELALTVASSVLELYNTP